MMILRFGREEVTRTPDPYVPNVVRYQLRHFSLTFVRFGFSSQFAEAKSMLSTESGCKSTAFF